MRVRQAPAKPAAQLRRKIRDRSIDRDERKAVEQHPHRPDTGASKPDRTSTRVIADT
jgi:hypothetical protein